MSPTSLDFEAAATNKTFIIRNDGGGTLTWSISVPSEAAWAQVQPTSGSGDATINVAVSRSGLPRDRYLATLRVNSNGGTTLVRVAMEVPGEAKPDLGVSSVRLDDPNLEAGAKAVARGTITSQGTKATPPGVLIKVRFYLGSSSNDFSRPFGQEQAVLPLGPGGDQKEVSTEEVVKNEGVYYMNVVVDPDNQVDETWEQNNASSFGPFRVKPASNPPNLCTNPSTLDFGKDKTLLENVKILNCGGGGTLKWELKSAAGYFGLSKKAGQTPDLVSVTVDRTGMEGGKTYQSLIYLRWGKEAPLSEEYTLLGRFEVPEAPPPPPFPILTLNVSNLPLLNSDLAREAFGSGDVLIADRSILVKALKGGTGGWPGDTALEVYNQDGKQLPSRKIERRISPGSRFVNFYIYSGLPAGTYTFRVRPGSAEKPKSYTAIATRDIDVVFVPVWVKGWSDKDFKKPDMTVRTLAQKEVIVEKRYPLARERSSFDGTSLQDAGIRQRQSRSTIEVPLGLFQKIKDKSPEVSRMLQEIARDEKVGLAVGLLSFEVDTGGTPGWTHPEFPNAVMVKQAGAWGGILAHELGHKIEKKIKGGLGDEYGHGRPYQNCNNPPPREFKQPGLNCDHYPDGNTNGVYIQAAWEPFDHWNELPAPSGSAVYGFMGAAGLDEDNRWVTWDEFVYLAKHLRGSVPYVPQSAQRTAAAGDEAIVLSGSIGKNGVVQVDPFYRISMPSQLVNFSAGEYSVVFQDSTGAVLATEPFDVTFLPQGFDQESDIAPFYLVVPYPSGSRQIAIKRGSETLKAVTVSPSAPVVEVTSPAADSLWFGQRTSSWQASDADGDALTYKILYTVDGLNWISIATNITQTSYLLDTSLLPGGKRAQIAILASDGVNTTEAKSPAFLVAAKGPRVAILSLEPGARYLTGISVTLEGAAHDFEDGAIVGDRLAWESDKDGFLGTGRVLPVQDLSIGDHIITFTAVDSDGNTGSYAIRVTNLPTYRAYFPLVVKESPGGW